MRPQLPAATGGEYRLQATSSGWEWNQLPRDVAADRITRIPLTPWQHSCQCGNANPVLFPEPIRMEPFRNRTRPGALRCGEDAGMIDHMDLSGFSKAHTGGTTEG